MNPTRMSLEDLVARLGAPVCKAYAAAIRSRSTEWLEKRAVDPESILIRNLEIRWDAGQGDSSKFSRLYLADDGCGNHYFINSNEPKPLVFLDSHDPVGIEETGLTLAQFLAMVDIEHVPAFKEVEAFTICRTDLPHRSILCPITLDEWIEVASRYPAIEYRGARVARNPFTGQDFVLESPGLAVAQWNEQEIVISLTHGRLTLENRSGGFRSFANALAQELGAQVI